MGACVGGGDIERLNALRLDVNNAFLVLYEPCDKQGSAACNDDAVTLENIRRKNHVGDAGFVFKREKDEALGGSGRCRATTHPAIRTWRWLP